MVLGIGVIVVVFVVNIGSVVNRFRVSNGEVIFFIWNFVMVLISYVMCMVLLFIVMVIFVFRCLFVFV